MPRKLRVTIKTKNVPGKPPKLFVSYKDASGTKQKKLLGHGPNADFDVSTQAFDLELEAAEQRLLWCTYCYAPAGNASDYNAVTDIMKLAQVDATGGSTPVAIDINLVPIEPVALKDCTDSPAQIQQMLDDIDVLYANWQRDVGAADARIRLHNLLASITDPPVCSTLCRALAEDEPYELDDDQVPLHKQNVVRVRAQCTYCNSLFNTPGTAYYRNTTWYQNCLTNPQCT